MPSGSELQEIPRSPFSIGRRGGKYQAQDKNVSNVQISSRRLIDEMQEAVWKITEFATGGLLPVP